jgi:hypothetical protein
MSLGQRTGALRGLVTDSTSGEALAFGNVFIDELKIGASTDARGYFYIPSILANKTYRVIISYIGYETRQREVFILQNVITHINVKLMPAAIDIGVVEKIGEKYIEKAATDISLERIFVKDLEMLPKSVETDLFRSLQHLPGVQTVGDVSARFFVRGGSSNQNLVLLNDVPVYSPFHALGLFGSVDPDMVNFSEFYKGGFTAEHGGRLSSLMRIVTKDGNKNKFGASASGSFLTAKALIEGPIPDGSFILTGRKSHSNAILKKFLNEKDVPVDFYDLSFKVNYSNPDVLENAKFTLHGFASRDFLDNSDVLTEDFRWTNGILGFKYFQWVTDSPIFFEFSVSISNFDGEAIPNLRMILRKSRKKSIRNILDDFNFGGDVTYIFDTQDEIGVGMKINKVKTVLSLENDQGAVSEIEAEGANTVIYAKYKILHIKDFGLDFGTRVNLTRFAITTGGEFYFEPRVNLSYQLLDGIKIKAAAGRYQQELTTISDENEVISIFEPWIITPRYLVPSSAVHYIFGLETELNRYLSANIEGYYKKIKNLPLLNENKYFPADPDLIAGKGEAYGVEVLSKYEKSFFNVSGSYSLSWSFKEIDGLRYRPRYDSRHSVNLSLEINLGKGWRASAVWQYNSGLPFTQLIGYYNRMYFDDLESRNYYFIPHSILAERNAALLPDYHRLDLNLSAKFNLSFAAMYLDFSIINVYNRKNLFYFERETGKRVNMLPFLPSAAIKIEL